MAAPRRSPASSSTTRTGPATVGPLWASARTSWMLPSMRCTRGSSGNCCGTRRWHDRISGNPAARPVFRGSGIGMSLQACAEIVERGDPDRFLATMAAPPGARGVLFPLYAFNIEVSRAPWVTEEPMIAEMRLQWWRDALDEIAAGGPVRSHEVTLELARVLDAPAARALDRTVAARRWDIYKDPFEDAAHFEDYLDATAAELMWQAVRLLGGPVEAEHHVRRLGHGTGLV